MRHTVGPLLTSFQVAQKFQAWWHRTQELSVLTRPRGCPGIGDSPENYVRIGHPYRIHSALRGTRHHRTGPKS